MKRDKLRSKCESEHTGEIEQTEREVKERKREKDLSANCTKFRNCYVGGEAGVDLFIAVGYLYRCNLLSPCVFVPLYILANLIHNELSTLSISYMQCMYDF